MKMLNRENLVQIELAFIFLISVWSQSSFTCLSIFKQLFNLDVSIPFANGKKGSAINNGIRASATFVKCSNVQD